MLFAIRFSSLLAAALLFAFAPSLAFADPPVFSGPQVGEKLPSFVAHHALRDSAGEEFDFVKSADGKPVLLIFFHELTRPGFGLSNAVARYAVEREAEIQTCVIFLSDDPVETRQWAKNVTKHLPDGVTYGTSPDGKEGPGAMGLNRNVKLTVLVGKENKVTFNAALGQPQLQFDGPEILQAINDVTGGGEAPAIETLAGNRMGTKARGMDQAKGGELISLFRAVVRKGASDGEIRLAAEKVDAFVAENDRAQGELGNVVRILVQSGMIEHASERAQVVLRDWMSKYGQTSPQAARAR